MKKTRDKRPHMEAKITVTESRSVVARAFIMEVGTDWNESSF